MCSPAWFRVEDRLNVWMNPHRPVNRRRAIAQWQHLCAVLDGLGHQLHHVDAMQHLPDQVFTRDPAIICPPDAGAGRVLTARWRYPQRAGETAPLLAWLSRHGYHDVIGPRACLEGGDVLDGGDAGFLLGYGFRSERAAAADLRAATGRNVTALRLIDPRMYHLDTALAIINTDLVAYYPPAFHPASRTVLEQRWPDAVHATTADALAFGLNLISDGHTVVMPARAEHLAQELSGRGAHVIGVDTSELAAAGGGPHCCTLPLPAPTPPTPAPADPPASTGAATHMDLRQTTRPALD